MCTPAISAARKVLRRSETHKAKVGDAWRDDIALRVLRFLEPTLWLTTTSNSRSRGSGVLSWPL